MKKSIIIEKLLKQKGGFPNHRGRPGKVGGSLPKEGASSSSAGKEPVKPYSGTDPRLERTGKNGTKPPRISIEKGKQVIRTSKGDVLVPTVRGPDKIVKDKKGNSKIVRGELRMPDGSALPPHAYKGTKPLSPNWQYVFINKDPNGRCYAEGVDAKGKLQQSYNKVFAADRTKQKFVRCSGLDKDFKPSYKKVDKDADSGKGSLKEKASCLRLVMSTGIRPTDENDNPKPDKEAFGAITMLGKHVFISAKKVYIELPAKKGTTYKATIDNPKVAADLIKRKRKAGNEGRIFNTSGNSVLEYSKKETGYLIKDYRTHIANALTSKVIKTMPKPSTEREFNSMRNKVGEIVSAKLCNTKGMALSSYIDPSNFDSWAKGINFKKKKGYEEEYILEFEEKEMAKKEVKDWENLSADDFDIDEIMKENVPVWDNIEDKEIYEDLLSELTEAERDAIVNDEPPSDRVLSVFNMTREEFEDLQKKIEEENK